ncbi:ABC transporter ATP-binding protein [Salinisphaera hydrothermalis]|uniref:Multidrug ABC transporter ATPase n=1 Tax=Salinisphaera hydrothermalis (strain C41B8) TaxID=1304275 RepID=A0A084IKD4_SALHC|nr:ABC transporter ATP-binding protein [Salinisphaera hydrothermalis]KEZ77168.1 multidrug ABC transporter ATPase [Salinisphaera hydrothermalis C41B8]
MSDTPVIEARGVGKRFQRKVALADIDLKIISGRIVGLIGPNGAGKTTLLNRLLGLSGGDGTLRVLGHDPIRERDALMRDVCFISDVATLPRWLRVREAVSLVGGLHPRFSAERCARFLARSSLDPNTRVSQLSKGMTVQLHLALIMAIDARLLVLDEPTLGLDLLFRRAFYDNLLGDYFDENRTILVTTHQVEEIENILTDVIFLRDGRKILDASMDELAERFVETHVAPGELDAARALGPIGERRLLGAHALIFDREAAADTDALATLDDNPRTPALADLFTACMNNHEARA